MLNTGKLAGRTLFITGASRGIGKAIALKAARDGANIVIAAKTATAHPKLPGTIYTAAKEVEDAGGKCLPCIVDIQQEDQVKSAVEEAVKTFGGIDILINNASAISLTGTLQTPMKKYDLMNNINTRGTYMVSRTCIPYLKEGKNPHILNLSPPLSMQPKWFGGHVAYSIAKYGMSMCVLGMAEEFKPDGIAVNALWPKTAIWTAAMSMLGGGSEEMRKQCRTSEILADAAYVMLTKDSKSFTGNFTIDEDVLKDVGVTDLDQYACEPGHELLPDFFLPDEDPKDLKQQMEQAGIKPAFSGSAPPAQSQVAKVFESIQGLLGETYVAGTQAVYQFELKGDEAGQWFLDLKNGAGSAGSGAPPEGAADVTMKMDSADFVKMFQGEIKPTAAFMSGKLKMEGDLMKAMKLETLMKKMPQSKL
ncbi:hydroxysteroid dehydrogenase-like protein 2 isoform X1 [Patiria miniata]|uniref:Hydroxysteroid dehydrogenase-like protein 2 n=1 Tax=Patiria miniata TaxID=46514 RepID=A0A914ATG6_PATMI|nr:hydroxysteroid dehydrogenase-like protein 2 isoform X1 [Patiria miniata]